MPNYKEVTQNGLKRKNNEKFGYFVDKITISDIRLHKRGNNIALNMSFIVRKQNISKLQPSQKLFRPREVIL